MKMAKSDILGVFNEFSVACEPCYSVVTAVNLAVTSRVSRVVQVSKKLCL
jgi:hypothetical protein